MIYDTLNNISRYRGFSKWFDMAIEFLNATNLDELPLGKTTIFEDKVFANVMEATAGEEEKLYFEIHKRYMDIQIDIQGTEMIQIGMNVVNLIDVYSPEKDFGTVACEKAVSCIMGKGRFILCVGEEAHKPGIAVTTDRYLKKCVIKVAVE